MIPAPAIRDAAAALRALHQCRRGLAMTELAFAFPILLLLIFGGLEIAQMAMTHLRVNQIAITVADNAGRVRTGIDESNIYEVFSGADLVGDPIAFKDNGRIVLSSLEPNGKTDALEGQTVNWQRCYGDLAVDPRYALEGTGENDASLADGLGEGENKIQSAEGTAVMFVEVSYRYTPLVSGIPGWGPQMIRYESAFNVRERTNQDITNVQNLALKSC
jgi:hypothetical protein